MIVSCSTVVFRQHPLEQALDVIRAAGYEYVETQAVGPWCPHVDVDTDDPIAFADLVAGAGIKGVTALWMRYGTLLSTERSVEYGIRSIEWAAAAGIPVVNGGDGFLPKGLTEADAIATFRRRLETILTAAEQHRVTFALEPHGTYSLTSRGLQLLLSQSHSEWFGVNYDAANIRRAGYVESGRDDAEWRSIPADQREDEVAVLEAVIDRVVNFHAKDLSGSGACVALGTGEVEVARCVELLKEHGYHGAIALETEGDEDLATATDIATSSFTFLSDLVSDHQTTH